MIWKYVVLTFLLIGLSIAAKWEYQVPVDQTEAAMKQMNDNGQARVKLAQDNTVKSGGYEIAHLAIIIIIALCVVTDLFKIYKRGAGVAAILALVIFLPGCRKPFQPIKLEVVGTNEEAFVIPLVGDVNKQEAAKTEAFLEKNLVFSKQIQIPQQWVSLGYETRVWNGEWRDAAVLIKVDKSPVTREWTADENSGTSNKNEAIWVMTSDQVEFSTGWTCTARINGHKEAVKFLYNYPNGSLQKVMDHEIRAKLQADWTMEVTDLPMETLRKGATPHVVKVIKDVTTFFEDRGINITNLGITGGFVYKSKEIQDTMVEVFRSEQAKSIAQAEAMAQKERNVKVQLDAEGKAQALLKEKKAESDGIKMVADAKAYEMEKAKANQGVYVQLKQIELEKSKLERWDGKFPLYYMGSAGPNTLLQVPIPALVGQQPAAAK